MVNPFDLGVESTELSQKRIKDTPFFTPPPLVQRDAEEWEKKAAEIAAMRDDVKMLLERNGLVSSMFSVPRE
ncbi:MAG: hypothetical protein AB2L14_25380 [Candidatus Xenobiia bacterium LiM19]